MEKELENRIFMFDEYINKENMEENIKEYIEILKKKYPNAVITKEFYKGQNVLVRVTKIEHKAVAQKSKAKEKEIDDWLYRDVYIGSKDMNINDLKI